MIFVNEDFYNNPDPTTIAVIGSGGTGSHIIERLAKIDYALKQMDKTRLSVTVYDPKDVQDFHATRQNFYPSEVGLNKAEAIVGRVNRMYGLNWLAVPKKYSQCYSNIIITSVDNVDARIRVGEVLKRSQNARGFRKSFYWIDCGNAKNTGQVILGGCGFKTILDICPNLKDHEDINEPSCSVRQTLKGQDLFINDEIGLEAAKLVWRLRTELTFKVHGSFVNQEKGMKIPIKV